MKVPLVIYANNESLLKKIGACHNNPEKSPATKINKQTACGYSSFTHCSIDSNKNKHDYYRCKDCMKNFCKDLKEHTKIINYEKLKMLPITGEENKSHNKQKNLLCFQFKF